MPDPLLEFVDAPPGRIAFEVALPAPPALPEVRGLLAGAAQVDLTPPPGMPKAGHSRNAQDGTGFRTRLRASVIHLRAGRSSLALVACDLHAGSAVLHHLVAEDIAGVTDVSLHGLFIGATHTHSGPGQFQGSDFYNRFASNRPGFDPAYTRFVARRVAAAVGEAVEGRRPAKLAVGSTEVWGVTRNRSLAAHARNPGVAVGTGPRDKYAAVNPWLHLLRVDAAASGGGFEPLGALAVFSIHGTGISRHDPAYSADVWSYLTGELANRVERRSGVRPVAGAVEGTHGDMTPAVRPGMLVYPEAERIGRAIGKAAAGLHDQLEDRLSGEVALAAGLRHVDLSAGPSLGGVTLPSPALGAAKLAGAGENGTPILEHLPPFSPGHPRRRPVAGHAEKRVVAGRVLHRVVGGVLGYPSLLPLQLLRIDSMALLGVPFEVTVEAGRRLAAEVAGGLGVPSSPAGPGMAEAPRVGRPGVVVSSVVNDYWDYLTTPEEYALQCYEGASTLYGPRSLEFVSAAVRSLAAAMAGGSEVAGFARRRAFRFHARRYLPAAPASAPPQRRLAGPAVFTEATETEDAFWEARWLDVAPGGLAWHEPLVAVEALDPGGSWRPAQADGRATDDSGWRVGVFHLGERDGGAHEYAARWYQPYLGRPQPHRFVLLGNAGRPPVAGGEMR